MCIFFHTKAELDIFSMQGYSAGLVQQPRPCFSSFLFCPKPFDSFGKSRLINWFQCLETWWSSFMTRLSAHRSFLSNLIWPTTDFLWITYAPHHNTPVRLFAHWMKGARLEKGYFRNLVTAMSSALSLVIVAMTIFKGKLNYTFAIHL